MFLFWWSFHQLAKSQWPILCPLVKIRQISSNKFIIFLTLGSRASYGCKVWKLSKGGSYLIPKSPPFVVTLINVDNKPPSHPPPLPSPLKLCNQLHFTLGELTSHLSAFHIPFHSLNSSILLLWIILNLLASYSKNHHLLLITRNIFCLDLLLKLGVLRILHKLFNFFVDWWQRATRPLERSAQ